MSKFFKLIKQDANKLPEVLEYFDTEYENARNEIKIKGNLQHNISELPSLYEIRFAQLQELEAILEHFNIKLRGLKSNKYQQLMNNSARLLSATDVKQYIDSDKNVIDIQSVINEIALIRNKFISLTKGFETKNWQLSNLVKLQCAGLDSIEI